MSDSWCVGRVGRKEQGYKLQVLKAGVLLVLSGR